jgi:hypothetical protein
MAAKMGAAAELRSPACFFQADVAQLVEQPIRNRQVSGSSPLVGSNKTTICDLIATAVLAIPWIDLLS